MDPLETLRGTPGEPFRPNAAAFGLLADFAQTFRRGKLGASGDRPGTVPPESQVVAKVKNTSLSHTYAVGDWAAVTDLPLSFSHTSPYPAAWRAGGRFHEINDEPLLRVTTATSLSCYAIFLEPCPPGFVARACVGGLAYTRVRLPIPGSLADVGVPSFANALAPDGTYPADPWAQLYGRFTKGPFRILQYFTDSVITLGSYKVVHALVEVNAPDVTPPPVPLGSVTGASPYHSPAPALSLYPRGFAHGVCEARLDINSVVDFSSWSAWFYVRRVGSVSPVSGSAKTKVVDPPRKAENYSHPVPFSIYNPTDDFCTYLIEAAITPNGTIEDWGGWYVTYD